MGLFAIWFLLDRSSCSYIYSLILVLDDDCTTLRSAGHLQRVCWGLWFCIYKLDALWLDVLTRRLRHRFSTCKVYKWLLVVLISIDWKSRVYTLMIWLCVSCSIYTILNTCSRRWLHCIAFRWSSAKNMKDSSIRCIGAFRLRVAEGLIYTESMLYINKWDKSCSRVITLLIRFAGLYCYDLTMRSCSY